MGMGDFAATVRALRVERGLSQEALAERAGVSARSVRNIELGRVSRPRPDTAALLGTGLSLTGEALADFVARAREPYWTGRRGSLPAERRPAQLPPDVPGFTGRAAELSRLDALVRAGGAAPVVITALGTAGVGKTALAVHWATAAGPRHFPDGTLYVNLRGYDAGPPVAPADALAGFLRALSVPPGEFPPDLDSRAALFRSRAHDRRLLVLLDNAASVAQVRPLLPAAAGCLAVVTSRDALAGLSVRDGARRLHLDLLPPAEALALLRELIGDRVDAEPAAATRLAQQCAHLPLALRLAAELAVTRPERSLADLVVELADEGRRLDLLDAGDDPAAAVGPVFSWSYRYLAPDAARLFRRLGLHPGLEFDAFGAAALAELPLPAAGTALDELTAAHLVTPTGVGRYGMHDLLRGYAASLVAADERRMALTRLLDAYLATAIAAADQLDPTERHRRPAAPACATPLPPVGSTDAAGGWLEAELTTLVRLAALAADEGWPAHADRLGAALYRYLTGAHFTEAEQVFESGLRAARAAGDRGAEATALARLGVAHWLLDRYPTAADLLQQAIVLQQKLGDRVGEVSARTNLGLVLQWMGRPREAIEQLRGALAGHRELGNLSGAARIVGDLGFLHIQLGDDAAAKSYLDEALATQERLGSSDRIGVTLHGLGQVEVRLGRYEAAAGHLHRSLALHRELRRPAGEAHVLLELGNLARAEGDDAAAGDRYAAAARLFRACGERRGLAEVLLKAGDVHRTLGAAGPARESYAAALDTAAEIGVRSEQAQALDGLARLAAAAGRPADAAGHWERALALLGGEDEPLAARIRGHLAEVAS